MVNRQRQLFDVLTGHELRLLQADVRTNPCALDELIDDSFVEFGSCGRAFRKPEILGRLSGSPSLEFAAENFRLREVIPGLAQLSFRLKTRNPASGEVSYTSRCSLWKRFGQNWKMVFHQGMPTAEF